MSSPASTRRGPRGGRPSRAVALRRRAVALALALLALAVGWVALAPLLHRAVREIALPLRHEDIIRQQARDKRLDPALIAAVIYTESRFTDRTSAAGAKGLMQLLPETAEFIARRSGGTQFERRDLATPQINIAYGSFYLRYLLDHYEGDQTLAIAAYNAGMTNVDRWRARARARGERFDADEIPFAETRAYVRRVRDARRSYRQQYARELGLS